MGDENQQQHVHVGAPSTHVFFNDGENANVYALVLKVLPDGNLNLHCIPESGQPYIETDIPNREPGNYDDNGGGDTWHTVFWADAEVD